MAVDGTPPSPEGGHSEDVSTHATSHAGVTGIQSLPSPGSLRLLRWGCSYSLGWATCQHPGPRTRTRGLVWERARGTGAPVPGDVCVAATAP